MPLPPVPDVEAALLRDLHKYQWAATLLDEMCAEVYWEWVWWERISALPMKES